MQATAAIHTARGFRAALKAVKEPLYADMINTIDCGPFDGGCLVFAQALQNVIGGHVVVILRAGTNRADHAAVHLNGKLYDFDGPLPPAAFQRRFSKNEFVEIDGWRKIEITDLPDAAFDAALQSRIEGFLRQAFATSF